MAASGLERDDGGLKIEPNFELLAILLALALQEEDAERFLEVYDNIVPKSLSTCEIDNLKEKSRELSDLPGQTLLQLKLDQENEAALFSSPSAPLAGGCLGRFVSRRIADSFHQQTEPEQSYKSTGKFLSRSGALLNQRLNVQNKINVTVSGAEQTRDYGCRINSGNQAGASYLSEHSKPQEFALRLNQEPDPSVLIADDDFSIVEAAGDTTSFLMPNKWSTMESDIAGVRRVPIGVKKTASTDQELVLMNGTAENVKDRTPVTDRNKHCVKSKPPQAPTQEGAKTKKPNCFPTSTGELHCDCDSDECTNEEKAALIPKSPPFNSLEDIGHSVGKLLTNNSLPKNSSCPPPLFLSKTPALTHPNSMDSSMAANAETKYGSISCSDVNSDAAKFDEFPSNIRNKKSILNNCIPDEKSANKKQLNNRLPNSDLTATPSAPEVPKSCVNKSSKDGSFEKEEFDFGCSEDQPQSIDTQWAAAKKKKKKSKKKKSIGAVNDAMNVNSVKLPVDAAPQSPPECRTKHQLQDSGTRAEVSSQLPNELGRHPPIVSSDSVTSSGDSSTDGGACLNDVGSVGDSASRKQPDALLEKTDLPLNNLDEKNTNQTSKPDTSLVGRMDKVQPFPNNKKGLKTQNNQMKLQHVDTTSKTDQPSGIVSHELSKVSSQPSQCVPPAKYFHSDSDSDKHDPQVNIEMQSLDTAIVSDRHQAATVGKPHSLSEPTASADSSADNDNADFKEVKYKRSLRSAKKRGGVMDDHRYAATTGRYMDRESFRRNILPAGLRKSSSEPTGMSQLGDKDSEDVDHNKLKPKNLSENLKKTDKIITPPVQTEPTSAPQFELSYASKVKSNMKASSLPLKLSPQVLLEFKDGDHVESPSTSENSMESVTAIKSTASDSKVSPSGITVLDMNSPINAEQSEAVSAQSAKDFQSVKSNIRPDKKYIAAQTARSDRSSSVGQGNRTFQRSSSVDHSKVIKEVSFDDTCRRAVSPQGPEASVQYLNLESSGLTNLTYANCLKLPPIPKTAAVSRQPQASNTPQAPMVGLKDLKSQPLGVKTSEKEPLVTSKASIVLSTNPPISQTVTGKGNLPAASKQVDRTNSSMDEKPINLRSRVQAPVPVPPPRNTSSPTPSTGSSTSKPYPVFDLEPQGNCGVTFGSLIFDKGSFEILEDDNATVQKEKPAVEFMSKAQVHVPRHLPTTQGQGLSCAELERSIISQHSAPSSKIILDTTTSGGHSQPAGGVSFGKFDLGIAAALDRKKDTLGEFNHFEVAAMLLAEWRKTEAEITQNKVTVIGDNGTPN